MARQRAIGVADAIRIIKGMGTDWPCSIPQRGGCIALSERDDYGREFTMRILQQYPGAAQFVPVGSRNRGDPKPLPKPRFYRDADGYHVFHGNSEWTVPGTGTER
jgi:hypothetical protein